MERRTVIFATPSFCEAENISKVVRVIDGGLSRYFSRCNALIVNADNNSPDGTKRAFLQTRTRNKKIYINSGERGKGRNVRRVFEFMLDTGADAAGFIDADVRSASPEWIKKLLSPVVGGKADHVLPMYLRGKYDATITNHLVRPVLYGLLGVDVNQPIGGEFAVSRRAAETYLKRRWPKSAYRYGIDVFLTTESVFHDLRIGQVFLGIKSHKPSAPKLNKMFLEVADGLFRQVANHEWHWRKDGPRGGVKVFSKPRRAGHAPHASVDEEDLARRALAQMRSRKKSILRIFREERGELEGVFDGAENKNFILGAELWARLLLDFIENSRGMGKRGLLSLRPLFFLRALTHFGEISGKNHKEAEAEVLRQAKIFASVFNDS